MLFDENCLQSSFKSVVNKPSPYIIPDSKTLRLLPNDKRSIDILTKMYHEILAPAFPIDEEREALSELIDKLNGNNPHIKLFVTIVGNDLNDEAKEPKIKCFSIHYYYTEFNVVLLGYIATAPEFRGQGIAPNLISQEHLMIDEYSRSIGKKLNGYFVECNDPEKVKPEEDTFDPTKRLQTYLSWGAKIIPFDYIQPPLNKHVKACNGLKLLAYPHPISGQRPSKNALKNFILGIYNEQEPYSGIKAEEDPDYHKMIRQIDSLLPIQNTLPKSKLAMD